MALHGDIRINGERIGAWSARRTTGDLTDDAVNAYDCDVQWSLSGGKRCTFVIEHRYGDGATALAAKVLTRAASEQPLTPAHGGPR